MRKVVTRFAPSPTGYLHIGGLRTALFNYLFARKNGGKFLLRIEDTDLSRNSQEATQAILKAFAWAGLDYDDKVLYQSQRFDIYKSYIDLLLKEGKAYHCYMSKEELDCLREEQKMRGETPRYDNRYRNFDGIPRKDVSPVVRIKAPLDGAIEFDDGVKGHIKVEAKELDDFIIARSDGVPTYNFVVVIDDALSNVSDIIRGDDHLSNTPKQILIYQALGLRVPKFYHTPMILNPEGKKLSKRDGAIDVMEYKKMGFLPEALLNFLIRLGWSYGDKEIFSKNEMLELFNPDELNSSASAYNQSKLLWLNAHYIKEKSNDELDFLLKDFQIPQLQPSQKNILYEQLKERAQTLYEFENMAYEVLTPPTSYDEKLMQKINAQGYEALRFFADELDQTDLSDVQAYSELLRSFMESYSFKPNNFMQPLRLALLGKSGGIGLAETLYILGKDEILQRLKTFVLMKG